MSAISRAEAASVTAMPPSIRTGVPAASSKPPIARQTTMAVPMSGCPEQKEAGHANHEEERFDEAADRLGRAPTRREHLGGVEHERELQQLRRLELIGPAAIQRGSVDRDPDPGSIAAIVSPNAAIKSSGVSALMTASPCREAAWSSASRRPRRSRTA